MSRKTSKDYFKEYNNAVAKLSSLETTIQNRAVEMVKKQPDVPYEDGQTVSEFMSDSVFFMDREARIYAYIDIIRKIEGYNEKQSGVVQTAWTKC